MGGASPEEMKAVLSVLVLAACLEFTQGAEVFATGNPYIQENLKEGAGDKFCSAAPCIPSLSPNTILTTPMPTQADTHLKTVMVKMQMGLIPVYFFQQPARLSPRELKFKLVLTTTLPGNFVVLPVSSNEASDSWFPGYKWSIVVCEGCNSDVTHLGWKFTGPSGT